MPNTFPSNSIASGESAISGSGQLRLAVDLDWPSDATLSGGIESVTFDPSGSLTEALGLAGKFAIYGLYLLDVPNTEAVTVKLTVDGVVIWNDVGFTPATTVLTLYGDLNLGAANTALTPFICKSSLSLEVQTATDTSVTLRYIAKPIL